MIDKRQRMGYNQINDYIEGNFMKKFLLFFLIGIFVALLGFQGGWLVRTAVNSRVEGDVTVEETPYDDGSIYISVTAVGDCTFGTDINARGPYSFDSVAEKEGDYSYFLKLVKPVFEEDDLTIVNLEGTLSDGGARKDKEFAFRGNPEYVNILTSSSVEAANIANNHSRDYGEESFIDTQTVLSDNNIIWCEGKDYGITEIKGVKIGLIGTNTQRYDGDNGFISRMEELKNLAPDIIIANFHWGEERAAFPNSTQTTLAHLAIDKGADLVIGHHPHVLQGIEKYKGKYILYSLGNFCFGGNKNPSDKDTMIFRQVFRIMDGRLYIDNNVSVIPCSISSEKNINNYQPMPLSGDEFERVKEKITSRSEGFLGIQNIKFIQY